MEGPVAKIENLRMIEAGFPCHQVGAETQRERGASSALPPLYFLHVWWARRPLTPSRAAILASLLPAGTDPDWFLRQLGIEKIQALVNGVPWVLDDSLNKHVTYNEKGIASLPVNPMVQRRLVKEVERRIKNRETLKHLLQFDTNLHKHPVITRWQNETIQLPEPLPKEGNSIPIDFVASDPAHINERIEFAKSKEVKKILGKTIVWDKEDLYGYSRAYSAHPSVINDSKLTVLDPTAGGGSIPFEAMRLGHQVIANELNPVAYIILKATLDYPIKFGFSLIEDLKWWGAKLVSYVEGQMSDLTPFSPLPQKELNNLKEHCNTCPEMETRFAGPEYDQTGLIYVRQVTCPSCGGEAPLLNTCWLAKAGKEQWGVRMVPDGRKSGGTVSFETYRVKDGKGPRGEDPGFATVTRGVGTCIHCKQAIPADEIKAQARGESLYGRCIERLYCVVAVRYQPRIDKKGRPQVYKTGKRKGEIRTKKVRFFRPPNQSDLEALKRAEEQLKKRWGYWDKEGLIPTESIPEGNDMRPVIYGMNRWCDLFTSRQLLGHLFLVEELNRIKPQILKKLGLERGRAVVTYLQFVIDKGLDYNSKQTRWHYSRGVVVNTFGRHDFSLKWTFGEMIFSGPNSGVAWGLAQIIDAYKGIVELVEPLRNKLKKESPPLRILHGTAAHMDIEDQSIDLICIDPPYFNNVQYAELSDFFYVWQRRTLYDLYPDCMQRRLTNKLDEAVANPSRDGSAAGAAQEYQRLMSEIFAECRRVLKNDALMTVMFTHKTVDAWETLTHSLIESGWSITSSMPVESEAATSIHQKDMAAAASSVFLTCRKRQKKAADTPSLWRGFGNTGVADQVRRAVHQGLQDFEKLKLNLVDELVAAYGRALWVLSEHWPVLDGDDLVTPAQAMTEASAVVAQHQFSRLTSGRLKVEDLNPEAAAALIFYGIFNMGYFSYDQALNLSRALNIRLETKTAGYRVEGSIVGINKAYRRKRGGELENDLPQYYAPVVSSGSRLRLLLPEERHRQRLENPQTEWDIFHGLISSYRQGDLPLARNYLNKYAAGREQTIMDLLAVWVAETRDEAYRKEGEAILFGLQKKG